MDDNCYRPSSAHNTSTTLLTVTRHSAILWIWD